MLSHHDFRKDIILKWINPREYEDAREQKKRESSSSTVSSITVDLVSVDEGPEIKKRRVCDTTVADGSDLSRLRLDQTLDHFPYPSEVGSARCGLHRWAGIETQKTVLLCKTCGVNLCLKCYRLFHITADLLSMRKKINPKYEEKRKIKRNQPKNH